MPTIVLTLTAQKVIPCLDDTDYEKQRNAVIEQLEALGMFVELESEDNLTYDEEEG